MFTGEWGRIVALSKKKEEKKEKLGKGYTIADMINGFLNPPYYKLLTY